MIEIRVEKELVSPSGPFRMHIDTRISKDRLYVVFGNSGAGKTTFLRILAGLTRPDHGFIRFGDEIWEDTEKNIHLPVQKRKLGFMFQEYALFPSMTVLENIYFACGRDRKYADHLVDKFGLLPVKDSRPSSLSGGQKQRTALARALAGNPGLLLLDEPLSALDHQTRLLLQDEISKARSGRNLTAFVVSHDLTEVFRLSGDVLKMDNGRISAQGSPEEIFMDRHISGKVQMTGCVVKIESFDTFFLLTIVTGMNQVIRVTAFENDVEDLHEGDTVMISTKAFNPIVRKL